MAETSPETEARKPSRLRRGLRVAGWSLGGVITLCLVLVLAVLHSSTVARILVGWGASMYAGAIPGDASVERVEGRLGGDLILHGVRLEDRDGNPLVSIDRLRIGVHVAAALTGRLDLGRIDIVGARVFLPPDDAYGFADLAPPEPDEPPEPKEGVGPDLPLRIEAGIDLVDFALIDGATRDEIATVAKLGIDAWGEARRAELKLELHGAVPGVELDSVDVALGLAWDEPHVRLSDATVQTSWGTMDLPEARLDVLAMRGSLEPTVIEAETAWIEAQLGLQPATPWRVELRGEGDPSRMDVEARLDAPDWLGAHARLSGRPSIPLDVAVVARVEPGPSAVSGLGDLRELVGSEPTALHLQAAVEGDPSEALLVGLALQCHGCDPRGMPMLALVRAHGRPLARQGRVNASFVGASVGLGIDGELDDTGAFRATADLTAPDLAHVAELIGRVAQKPDLAGAASARLDCRGTVEPRSADCAVELGLREGRPVRLVDIAADVRLGDVVEVVAQRLRVEAPPLRVALAGGRPRVVVDDTQVRIDDLDLRVAIADAVGRVTAGGRLDASGRHALDVGVRGFELAGLDALVPGLGARGRVDLEARLEGTTEEPVLDARVVARGLGWRAFDFGIMRAELGYARGRGRLAVRSPAGLLQGLQVDADIPVALPGEGTPGGLRRNGSAHASIHLEALDLGTVAASVPEPMPLAGRFDLDASLEGSLGRPRLRVDLDARELQWDETPMGSVQASLAHASGTARLEVAIEHPSVRALRATAETALALDLAAPRVGWKPADVRRATLTIESAELDALSTWLPEPALAGRLSLDAQLEGGLEALDLAARIALADVAVDGRRLGHLDAELGFTDRSVSLRAVGGGPALEGLGVSARVPVRLSPVTGEVVWLSHEDHEIDVALIGVHLVELTAWLPEPLDVEGRGKAIVSVRGSGTAPIVESSIGLERLRYGGRSVGRLELDAGYADEEVRADLRLQADATRTLTARARVPVRIDAAKPAVDWRSERMHTLEIDAPHIDRAMVEPFVALPESLDFALALHASGQGNLTDPTLDLRLHGELELEGSPRQSLETTLSVAGRTQRARLTLGDAERPLLAVDGRLELPLDAVARGTARPAEAPLHVDVAADVDMALAAGLAPEIVANPEGRLALQATVEGTPGKPILDGHMGISGGALTVVPLRQRLEAIALEVSLTRRRIELGSFTARSGRGSLHASGHVDIAQEGLQGQVRFRGQRVPLRKPGLPHMELTTDVRAELSTVGARDEIGVDVSRSRVDVSLTQSAAARPIPSSDHVHFVATLDDAEARRPEARAEPKPSPGKPTTINLRIIDPVRITGSAVDMSWSGALSVNTTGTGVETRGALSTQDGFFELFGNQFRIEEGSVFVPEGPDGEPFVDLTAITQVAEVQITAHVRGRVSRPELIFSSTPAMTQSQIFTMLLTGSPDVDSADAGDVEARAASMLAAVSNPALQRQLSDRIGVDRVGVGFGDRTDQPILSAGKFIGKKVYVESQYRHNAAPTENRAQLMMRYRLAPRWSLETVFGDAAAGGIDLFWGRAFDIRRRRRSTRPPEEPRQTSGDPVDPRSETDAKPTHTR